MGKMWEKWEVESYYMRDVKLCCVDVQAECPLHQSISFAWVIWYAHLSWKAQENLCCIFVYHAVPNYWSTSIMFLQNLKTLISLLEHTLRRKAWEGFKDSLWLMMPWMVVYDNTHYNRWWLPVSCQICLFHNTMSSLWKKHFPYL